MLVFGKGMKYLVSDLPTRVGPGVVWRDGGSRVTASSPWQSQPVLSAGMVIGVAVTDKEVSCKCVSSGVIPPCCYCWCVCLAAASQVLNQQLDMAGTIVQLRAYLL